MTLAKHDCLLAHFWQALDHSSRLFLSSGHVAQQDSAFCWCCLAEVTSFSWSLDVIDEDLCFCHSWWCGKDCARVEKETRCPANLTRCRWHRHSSAHGALECLVYISHAWTVATFWFSDPLRTVERIWNSTSRDSVTERFCIPREYEKPPETKSEFRRLISQFQEFVKVSSKWSSQIE